MSKLIDLTKKRFGRLTVVKQVINRLGWSIKRASITPVRKWRKHE